MEMKGKSKITGLKAKRSLDSVRGKDPKKAITGNTIKGSGMSLPYSKSGKPSMKARSKKTTY